MRFADECRQAAEPIWAAIFAHPLLRQLCDGTLPIDTFRYFLVQDWHYLEPSPAASASRSAKRRIRRCLRA